MYETDFQYEYKDKKKNTNIRKQKIILLGSKSQIMLLNKNSTKEFFIDIIHIIVPKNFKPCELLVFWFTK